MRQEGREFPWHSHGGQIKSISWETDTQHQIYYFSQDVFPLDAKSYYFYMNNNHRLLIFLPYTFFILQQILLNTSYVLGPLVGGRETISSLWYVINKDIGLICCHWDKTYCRKPNLDLRSLESLPWESDT